MFTNAYKIASQFTAPVIQSIRYFDGKVESGIGSFILLNNSGWILTAAHIVAGLNTFRQHQLEITVYHNKEAAILANGQLNAKQKRHRIDSLKKNSKWITNISYWWGADGVMINAFNVAPVADLAVGQINNYNGGPNQIYPRFKRTSDDFLGKSLCKLGFPFYNVKTQWDQATGNFSIPQDIFPVPRFPIDGIGARFNVVIGPNNQTAKFIETTSPGLKGQSGGPIFDAEGNICAMQSRTNHFPLGFNPEISVNGKPVTENQFLNVGVGITTETILPFLSDNNVLVDIVN
jgi:hypothetical protein